VKRRHAKLPGGWILRTLGGADEQAADAMNRGQVVPCITRGTPICIKPGAVVLATLFIVVLSLVAPRVA